MSGDIVERLRSQHSDVRQGAYYSQREDPAWDATADAADEIERLRAAGDALAEVADEWPELVEAWREARR